VQDFARDFNFRLLGFEELSFEEIVTDSREVKPRKAFAALEGKRVDGHDFIEDAYHRGARVFFISFEKVAPIKLKYANWFTNAAFLYRDYVRTEEALIGAARQKSNTFSGEIIGITGSVGKTTVKEMVSFLLSPKYEVFKVRKSFNTPIGLAVEVLNARPNADYYVFEYGARKKNDIEELLDIVKPTKVIITNFGYAHLGIFGSRDEIFKEKIKLAKADTVREVYLNSEDDYYERAKAELKSYSCRVYSAGKSERDDLRYEIKAVDDWGYPTVRIYFRKQNFELKLPVPGLHNVGNFALASLVALKAGVEEEDYLKVAHELRLPRMRLEIVNHQEMTIINDSYNSNPASLKAALEFLFSFTPEAGTMKIAVLGDMLELGDQASKFHEEAGKLAKKLGIDAVIYLGGYAEDFLRGYGEEHFYAVKSHEEAAKVLKQIATGRVVLLLKGSRALELEKVLEYV
jgi:UDP-N-acetylmuramoyl-tripeptide--D-alanyl-D-alanine ligase